MRQVLQEVQALLVLLVALVPLVILALLVALDRLERWVLRGPQETQDRQVQLETLVQQVRLARQEQTAQSLVQQDQRDRQDLLVQLGLQETLLPSLDRRDQRV